MTFVREIIKEFDGTDETIKLQRELIETLEGMATAKGEMFKLQIQEDLMTAGTGSNFTIPIESITNAKFFVRAYASENTDQITAAAEEIMNDFVRGGDGNVIKGIAGLIGSVLDVFLGKASASSGTTEEYYVMTRGLSIIRLDMKAWYQNVAAQSVYQKMQRVCCFVGVRSAVDLSKLGFSTFISLYEDQLSATKMSPAEIRKAVQDVREIFDAYSKTGGPNEESRIERVPAQSHIRRFQT
ncbi:MAG: hypothetical protein RLZZ413_3644 [Pseudomonadota bacterium]|jgi:hypothetical protein